MCGLCGMISTALNTEEIDAFRDLMAVSTLRGGFGAGLVAVPTAPTFEIEILKHASFTAAELSYSPEFDAIHKEKAVCTLLGHARQPTKGGLSLDDAHPHIWKNVIGMHNGTLTSVMGQAVDDKNDSKMLFRSIAEKGLQETIKSTEGSYSICYIDKEAKELVFLRNSHRPLFFAHVGNLNTLFWASEAAFLTTVLNRRFKNRGKLDLYRLPENTATYFDIRPHGKLWPKRMASVIQEEKKEVASSGVPLLEGPKEKGSDTLYETYPRKYVAFKTLRTALQDGCAFCEKQMTVADYSKKRMYWVDTTEFICKHCSQHNQEAQDYLLSMGIITPQITQDMRSLN